VDLATPRAAPARLPRRRSSVRYHLPAEIAWSTGMATQRTADRRPDALHEPAAGSPAIATRPSGAAGPGGSGGPGGAEREARLRTLYARWEQFAAEYSAARQRNDQEVMTNLRGLMLLIKKEIARLRGTLPEFPYPDEPHLADL
jgi:hypothetical protein